MGSATIAWNSSGSPSTVSPWASRVQVSASLFSRLGRGPSSEAPPAIAICTDRGGINVPLNDRSAAPVTRYEPRIVSPFCSVTVS